MPLLYPHQCAFSSIDDWLLNIAFGNKVVFFSWWWKHVISFKIKKQYIFNVSLMVRGFVFVIHIVCSNWANWNFYSHFVYSFKGLHETIEIGKNATYKIWQISLHWHFFFKNKLICKQFPLSRIAKKNGLKWLSWIFVNFCCIPG